MTVLAANPCEAGHQGIALLKDVTTLGERLPRYLCNRCGTILTFEQAIRNDERLIVTEAIATALEGVSADPFAWIYLAAAAEWVRNYRKVPE